MNVKQFAQRKTAKMSDDKKRVYAFRLLRNIFVHEIIGPPPATTLHLHAWDYKKQYTRDFINNYYNLHNQFPTNTHNVGNSFFPAVHSHVNFSTFAEKIRNDVVTRSIDEYPKWVINEV